MRTVLAACVLAAVRGTVGPTFPSCDSEPPEKKIAVILGYNWTWPRSGLRPWPPPGWCWIVQQESVAIWEGRTTPCGHGGSQHGYNPGNNIWASGVTNLLDECEWRRVEMNRSIVSDPKHRETWAALVSGTGPLVGYNEPASRFSAILEPLRAVGPTTPFLIFGIGVKGQTHNKLGNASTNFVREINDRLETAGGLATTRGSIAYNLSRSSGLTSDRFRPLCGPSLLLNVQPNLGKILETKFRDVEKRAERGDRLRVGVAVHGQSRGPVHVLVDDMLEREYEVFQFSQDVASVEKFSHIYPHVESHIFFDVETWVRTLADKVDFYIGERIHGSMAAVAAEVPTITVTVDARQREFTDCTRLARIDVRQAQHLADDGIVAFIHEGVKNFDGTRFDKNRANKASEYAKAFDAVGIQLNRHIRALASFDPDRARPSTVDTA